MAGDHLQAVSVSTFGSEGLRLPCRLQAVLSTSFSPPGPDTVRQTAARAPMSTSGSMSSVARSRRKAKSKTGRLFVGFLPAVSNLAAKLERQEIDGGAAPVEHSDLSDIAAFINPIVRGRIDHYGRFYRSRLTTTVLRQINEDLIRWAM